MPISQRRALLFLGLGTILFALGPALIKLLTLMGGRFGLQNPGAVSFCNVLFVGNFCAGLVTLAAYGRRSLLSELRALPHRTQGALLLGAAMHRNVNDRHVAVVRAMSFVSAYANLRLADRSGDDDAGAPDARALAAPMRQEVAFNTGRAFHQLGMLHHAAMSYRRALEMHDDMPAGATVTREAAHNLVLLYQQTGAISLARRVVARYLTIG